MITPKQSLIFLYFFFFPSLSFAAFQSDDEIVVQLIAANKDSPIPRRIETQSGVLLNTPYLAGALGEGISGKYDQNPLYRFDHFDCETYVDTVMALALAKNLPDFRSKINQIRYKRANVNFTQRNHFPSADWIPSNKKNGFIHELTYFIAGQKTRVSIAQINRRSWYHYLTPDRIQITYLTPQEKESKLAQLKSEGEAYYFSKKVSIAYIPVFELLRNPKLRQKIPSGSLIFFVGHDAYLTSRIGTPMNVLHMGFAIWNKGQLYCRMASSKAKRVLDVRFQDYLKTYLPLGTLDGIGVWSVQS